MPATAPAAPLRVTDEMRAAAAEAFAKSGIDPVKAWANVHAHSARARAAIAALTGEGS